MKPKARGLLLLFGLIAIPLPGLAQITGRDLSQLSIEDLMRIDVTAAGRKEQRATDVSAAIFVITNEDIRRSGMTSIPDLLRLVPGVNVAQINSNKWAVSIRGFNGLYANKLLVLMDGRSVYNRLFSGVLWDAQDVMLDDVDRIEVIRGPAAALWGANAVNGVINIVSKAAAGTQGALVRADAGGMYRQVAVRYGGALRAARYRVYAEWTNRDESLLSPGVRANDASYSAVTGFRTDWTTRSDAFVVKGNVNAGEARALWPNLDPQTALREPIANDPSDSNGGHLLGRWTHTRTNGATLQVQSFADFANRMEPVGHYHRHTVDVDTQFHTMIGARHDVVAGAGYRYSHEGLMGRGGFSLTPDENQASLATGFIQDEIAFAQNRLAVTLGSQVQYDSDAGAGAQPTARAMWKGLPRQRIWAAWSRALRTPSLADRGIGLAFLPVPGPGGLPLFVTLAGNPAAETETLADLEAGYRLEIGTVGSIDVTGFMGRYDHLPTTEPGQPQVLLAPSPHVLVTAQIDDQLKATTRGLEVSGNWMPIPAWRFDGSFTAFAVTPHLPATSQDPAAAQNDGSSPRRQWQLRSVFTPHDRAALGLTIFHTGPLEIYQVSAYTRVDVTAEWRLTNHLSAMAIGQNLVDASHAEFSTQGALLLATEVPRSAALRLRWVFP